MATILEVRDVSHSFRGLHVLRGVSFVVEKGAVVGLIGPNGAGKSTLFNIISGFLQADAGNIVYCGSDITRHSIQRRSHAGLVRTFQTPEIFQHLSVHENLMAGYYRQTSSGVLRNLLGLPGSRRDVRAMARAADEACETFSLTAVRDQVAGNLPAGQRRLLELARAAVSQPLLLCLDEPSSGLNSEEVASLMAALNRLNREGVSILLVSHDMELVSVASEINVLCFGEIISQGSLEQVRTDERVREAYLGV